MHRIVTHVIVIIMCLGISFGDIIIHPIDNRLTSGVFLGSSNRWDLIQKTSCLSNIESAANTIQWVYGFNEWAVFTLQSNDAKNDYFTVHFANNVGFKDIHIASNITEYDTDLVKRITNNGILDGYDVMRLQQAVSRESTLQTWYLSNDSVYFGTFAENPVTNIPTNISYGSLQIPLFLTAFGNPYNYQWGMGIGAGYQHTFDWAVIGANIIPFTGISQYMKVASNTYLYSDSAWQMSGEFYIRTGLFLIHDRLSYFHSDVTEKMNSVVTSGGMRNLVLLRMTNDVISNSVIAGLRIGPFRCFYTFESTWTTGKAVAFSYDTNGNLTGSSPYTNPWQMTTLNSLRLVLTDKKMSFGNNTTYYLDSTWKLPDFQFTNSLFIHRMFGNLNIDELFSIYVYGYMAHSLKLLYINKIADSSYFTYTTSQRAELALLSSDMHLEGGINYWNQLGTISLSAAMTRMHIGFNENAIKMGVSEYRVGLTFRSAWNIFACGAEYRFNFQPQYIKENWYDGILLKAKITLPFTDSDFEKYDIVRAYIE
ncbi:MAG: hypothetical protein AABZ39_02925 [Spirochaetota bacterium]